MIARRPVAVGVAGACRRAARDEGFDRRADLEDLDRFAELDHPDAGAAVVLADHEALRF